MYNMHTYTYIHIYIIYIIVSIRQYTTADVGR